MDTEIIQAALPSCGIHSNRKKQKVLGDPGIISEKMRLMVDLFSSLDLYTIYKQNDSP